jgi:predicted DNA binding protein
MLLEVWRVHQPDCPVVAASEAFKDTRLTALSSRLLYGRVFGFLKVSGANSYQLVEFFRERKDVVRSEVVSKRVDSTIVSLLMDSTQLMNTLSSHPKVFYFTPLYAADGYEYFLVAHAKRGIPVIKRYLKETGHEIKVRQSVELPDVPLGSAVIALTRITRLLDENRLLSRHHPSEEFPSSHSLKMTLPGFGISGRDKRRVLYSYEKILNILEEVYKH